jgi:hypothetical protein
VPGCDAGCIAFVLPGGLDVVRKIDHVLHRSVFENSIFGDAEAIQIANVPGYVLKFDSSSGVDSFNFTTDCSTYGQHVQEGVQMCIRPANSSLLVGKARRWIIPSSVSRTKHQWLTYKSQAGERVR